MCISCGMLLPETNFHDIDDNEAALRFAGRIPFEHVTSYAYFTNNGLLQHLLHELKYKGKKEVGDYLGSRLGLSLKNADWIASVDMIIPVPLHAAKQARRGYNQSAFIAEGMSRMLQIPVDEKALVRVKDTDSQTHKTRNERVQNMADAFMINTNVNLSNKHILLCDDVLTTGATLEACALALRKEESIKISIVTIGIAIS